MWGWGGVCAEVCVHARVCVTFQTWDKALRESNRKDRLPAMLCTESAGGDAPASASPSAGIKGMRHCPTNQDFLNGLYNSHALSLAARKEETSANLALFETVTAAPVF